MDNLTIQPGPKLIDAVLQEWQDELMAKLTWLTVAYGRVTDYYKGKDRLPKIHIGQGEYRDVMPDDRVGNYSFFEIDPRYDAKVWNKNKPTMLHAKYGLVFWFDIRTIFQEIEGTEREAVKAHILYTITNRVRLRTSQASFRIESVVDDATGVFTKYAQKDHDEKYLMYPYGAVRIDGTLQFTEGNYTAPSPAQTSDDGDADYSE